MRFSVRMYFGPPLDALDFTMTQQLFELIKILFWGNEWESGVLVHHIEQDKSREVNVRQESFSSTGLNYKDSVAKGWLIGVENHIDRKGIEAMEYIIRGINCQTVAGLYFVLKKKRHAMEIVRKIQEVGLGEVEIYGMDPDYFLSLVPLGGINRKKIEEYVLSLKVDFTIRARVKNIIKRMLIDIGLSEQLYERFIVTVNPVLDQIT